MYATMCDYMRYLIAGQNLTYSSLSQTCHVKLNKPLQTGAIPFEDSTQQ